MIDSIIAGVVSQHRGFQALIELTELGNVGERLLELKDPPFPET